MINITWTVLCLAEFIFAATANIFGRYLGNIDSQAIGTVFTELSMVKLSRCCLDCDQDKNCFAVNHKKDIGICEVMHRNTNANVSFTIASGWTAYVKTPTYINLSEASTSQSSTHSSGDAWRAIDGNKAGYYWLNRSCASTKNSSERWWKAEMQNIFAVSVIVLWNRIDGNCFVDIACWLRLQDIEVRVGMTEESLDTQDSICGFYAGPPLSAQDNPIRIYCGRVMIGRFLKIEKMIPGDLTLCEVEVIR